MDTFACLYSLKLEDLYNWEWIESRERLGWHSTNWKTRRIQNMVVSTDDFIIMIITSLYANGCAKMKVRHYIRRENDNLIEYTSLSLL